MKQQRDDSWVNEAFKGPDESKEHPDYLENLNKAKSFIAKVTPSLPEGMRAYISSSQWLKDVFLTIVWIPPEDVKLGKFATCIFMHQNKSDFLKRVQLVFESYILYVEKIEKNRHIQKIC